MHIIFKILIILIFFNHNSYSDIPIIVISPSKTNQTLKSVGSDVTIIDNKSIYSSNENFVGNIIEDQIPGSSFSRQGGNGTNSLIQLRGLPKRYTNVYIDGVKQSDPSSPDNAYYFDNLTSGSIKSVEVLKGNQSSIYGSSAIGGAINLFSRDGREENNKTIKVETGSNNKKNIVMIYGDQNRKYNYSFTAEKFLTDNISAMSDNKEKDPYKNDSVHGAFGYNLNNDLRVETNFKFTDTFLNFDEVTSGREDRNTSDNGQFSSSIKIISDKGKLKNTFILGNFYSKREVSNYNQTSKDIYYGERKNINYYGEYNFNLDKKIIFGLDNEFNRANFTTWAVNGNKISDDAVNSQYFEIQNRHSKKLFSSFGLRNDIHSEAGAFRTGRVTGSYNFDSKTKLRSSLGTGIRFGSLNDYYYDTNVSKKENLKPEKSFSIDAGIDKKLTKFKSNLKFTMFYTQYKDNISNWASNTDGGRTNYAIENSDGKIKSRGFDLKIKKIFNKKQSGLINYTYTKAYDGEDCDDPDKSVTSCAKSSYPVRVPKHQISSSLQKNFNKYFQSKLKLKFISSRRDYGNTNNGFADVILDEYTTVDLYNNFNFLNKTFYINIINIFNEEYEDAYQYSSNKRGFNFGFNKVF